MLQNPSKYHPNPLSHFLALHNSANQQQSLQNHHTLNSLNGSHNSNVNSSLDVGKSFTIAAILGLQKNAIDHHQRDFNSVMNLSLNGHNIQQRQNNLNNLNSSIGNNKIDTDHCDNITAVNNVVNRFLPSNQNNSTNQLRINQFAAAAAVAAANSAPSALQSLQQLHHQHAKQVSLNFQRDSKHKNDHHISSKKSSLKSKRVRTIFTPEQLERLEAEFERQQYMVGPERLYLAHTLQLTEAQVKVWFQNRRIKWRKTHLEVTQQRLALIRQNQLTNEDGGNINETEADVEITNDINSLNNSNISINHQSESDLSICNDSIDGESINDIDEP